jgi:hypothetical protein
MNIETSYTNKFPFIELIIKNVYYTEIPSELDFKENHLFMVINKDVKILIHKHFKELISEQGQKVRIYYSLDSHDRFMSLISLEII